MSYLSYLNKLYVIVKLIFDNNCIFTQYYILLDVVVKYFKSIDINTILFFNISTIKI